MISLNTNFTMLELFTNSNHDAMLMLGSYSFLQDPPRHLGGNPLFLLFPQIEFSFPFTEVVLWLSARYETVSPDMTNL